MANSGSGPSAAPASRTRRLLLWLGAGALLAAIVLLWSLLPVAAWLEALRTWIVGLGFRGIAIFALIYIIGAVVLAPEALLPVLAGFAFGFRAVPFLPPPPPPAPPPPFPLPPSPAPPPL